MSLRQLLSAAALMVGAAVSTGASVAASPATSAIVVAREFMFAPVALTVPAGSTVTWTNTDDEPHTIVSDAGLFRSGALDTKESFSFRFDKPGSYHYVCSIHPRMVGTIIVE